MIKLPESVYLYSVFQFLLLISDLESNTCAFYDYQDECHKSNDGCGIQTETCTYASGNRGCYTLWSGEEKILQGCWLPSIRTECMPGECVSAQAEFSTKRYRGTFFCCCFGDNCNENYGLSNHIPGWP